jgi:acyl-coenzyme A thioesterase PaaI-like protein
MTKLNDVLRHYLDDEEITEREIAIRRCADLVRKITAQLVKQEFPIAGSAELQSLLVSIRDAGVFDDGTLSSAKLVRSEGHPWVGPSNAVAPPMRIHLDGNVLVGIVTCSDVYSVSERVHGGVIAGLFDTILAMRGSLSGAGTTANLVINYKKSVPLNRALRLEAKVDRIDGRKCYVSGRMQYEDEILVEANALTIVPRS